MLFFTSDTHFNDPRILRLDRRPFASLAEHDNALIASWNETVTPDDEVWHLGDFARHGKASVGVLLSRLHGRKNLIIGNNDSQETVAADEWASAQHYAELRVDGVMLILCHYPFRTWNQMAKKSINLHGHSHGKLKPLTRQYDVGVDARSFRPISLPALLQQDRARPQAPQD
ncbi:metallophosphoesterase family protein [Mesorhizobium sp. B1-1-8]|uniref:metallophosphoesterase family protein n=1 Tax=Mesorhizobium sp. B1-1-8 TaxID=2589976 RepID=UPI00112EA4A5|nr:metallophosphoesterase family protein [Mesorhizobium sp. B1-1-8]UCI10566.1 metallophosphoesterase family protein [Mesorhizobium sp. B1-1-8]